MDSLSSTFICSLSGLLSGPHPPPLPRLTISAVKAEEKAKTQTQTQTQTQLKQSDTKERSITTIKTRKPPSPPPSPSLAATFCNALDDIINNFIDPPLFRPSVDPRNVLSDNFAPVSELPPTPCPIIHGRIPPCLAGGAYIRNGPNPQYLPRGPHHLFDGDGMLHSLLLPSPSSSSPPLLSSRFVRTYKYLTELQAGASVLPNVFSGFHGSAGVARGAVTAARFLAGQINLTQGVGLANTSLIFFAGRLYALGESDLPYSVHLSATDGDIATLGREDFSGKLLMGMTAHPKKDPTTGELFAFRYGPIPPFLSYFRFDRDGNKLADVPIFSVREPSFLHDFAITENYAIFPDIQIVMKPMDMLLRGGAPVGSNRAKVPRLGLLPRYATSESDMRWFEVPGFNIIHALNAWEEDGGDTVVLVAANVLSIEHALERMDLVHTCVELVRIDLRTGDVSRKPLAVDNLEFGVIHPGYIGTRNRYGYLGIGAPMPKISGVVKLDFSLAGTGDCVVAKREFSPGCYGGEPFFVPEHDAEEGEEDEGYLVSYVHNEVSGESSFLVMDARSPELEIVAEVQLPARVPYGFHGLFVTAGELRSQCLPQKYT
ncbi:putative oxidoreductase [Dioscorea sansibarensis]